MLLRRAGLWRAIPPGRDLLGPNELGAPDAHEGAGQQRRREAAQGGEALRLAIARAAADPQADLLLVDEPTAHLDAATAADVTERLLMLAQGKTLIVATHDPVLAARLDRSLAVPLQPAAAHRSTA